jgi:hypothetical protein
MGLIDRESISNTNITSICEFPLPTPLQPLTRDRVKLRCHRIDSKSPIPTPKLQ